jgi:hypothetical protein
LSNPSGRKALVAILQHAHGAVALRKLGAVRSQDHGYVRVDRRLDAQRAQHVDLARRVVDVIVAADDVRDAHVVVVDHDAEIVGRRAIRARDDQVIELAAVEHDRAVHDIVDDDAAGVGIAEAHDGRDTGNGRGPRAATAVVARFLLARSLRRTHGIELLLAAIAMVGTAVAQELRDHSA